MAHDRAWMIYAACQSYDTAIFFPKAIRGRRTDTTEAKKICAMCPVKRICLQYAIAHQIPYGVWGGKDGYERAEIASQNRQKLTQHWFEHHATDPMRHSLGPYVGQVYEERR